MYCLRFFFSGFLFFFLWLEGFFGWCFGSCFIVLVVIFSCFWLVGFVFVGDSLCLAYVVYFFLCLSGFFFSSLLGAGRWGGLFMLRFCFSFCLFFFV